MLVCRGRLTLALRLALARSPVIAIAGDRRADNERGDRKRRREGRECRRWDAPASEPLTHPKQEGDRKGESKCAEDQRSSDPGEQSGARERTGVVEDMRREPEYHGESTRDCEP